MLIGTAPAAPEYRCTEQAFAELATEIGCPYFCDVDARRHLDLIREVSADIAISVNWPTLLAPEVLDAFPNGILNAHAGALPRFRGNAAPNWAILTGEECVVLSVHQMTAGLDEGPLFAQRSFPLDETTYISDVYAFLDEVLPQLFVEVLDRVAAGNAVGEPQNSDTSLALRGLPRLPVDSRIDWSLPALQIARLVRASSDPFAGAYTHLGTARLTVWRARAEPLPYAYLGTPGQVARVDRDRGTVAVLTGDGLLVLEEVSLADGERRLAPAVIRSIRTRLGLDLEGRIDELSRRVAELEQRLIAEES